MVHCDGQSSVNMALIGNHCPGITHALATVPCSSWPPSVCTVQVAAAVAATVTPMSMPSAPAGAVPVTVSRVHAAAVAPVRVTVAP
jgi:hypothetical protein